MKAVIRRVPPAIRPVPPPLAWPAPAARRRAWPWLRRLFGFLLEAGRALLAGPSLERAVGPNCRPEPEHVWRRERPAFRIA